MQAADIVSSHGNTEAGQKRRRKNQEGEEEEEEREKRKEGRERKWSTG